MKFLILPALMLSLQASAAWIEDSVSFDVDTTDPKLIASSISPFQELLNYLSGETLTSPSRVKVSKLVGRVARYHWENDAQCSVKDPTLVRPVEMSEAHADFHYESDPATTFSIDAIASKADPCSAPPPPKPLRAYKK
jgi:hypothetical protein